MLQLQCHQQQKGVSSTSSRTFTTSHTARSQVVMNISITRMDPQPPVMNIDQNLLVELSRLFPQIPSHVIVSFIHQNQNNKERCVSALKQQIENLTQPSENNAMFSHTTVFKHPGDNGMCHVSTGATGGGVASTQYSGFYTGSPGQFQNLVTNVTYTQTKSTISPSEAHHKGISPEHCGFNQSKTSASPTVNYSYSGNVHRTQTLPASPMSVLTYNPSLMNSAHVGPTSGHLKPAYPPTHQNPFCGSPSETANINPSTVTQMFGSCCTTLSPPRPTNQWENYLPQQSTASSPVTFLSQVNKYIGPHGGNNDMVTTLTKPRFNITFQRQPNATSGITGLVHRQGSEDMSYIQSLVLHQNSKLKKLQEDLKAACDYCEELKKKVALKEKQVLERRKCRSGPRTTISMTDLQKVQDENRTLQVDSHILMLEFDRITKGEPVIGQDPNESFYARIPGGQKGILLLPNNLDHGSYPNSATNRTSTASVQPPSHPPAPPAIIASNTEPNRQLQHVREVEEENWNCSACTFANHPELHNCEMCNMPRLTHR